LEQKAYFYVCGDAANMAREVNAALIKITAEQRGIPDAKAEEIVKSMRSANQYQVRRFCIPHFTHRKISLGIPNPTVEVGRGWGVLDFQIRFFS
jgi:hypothetical protein